MLAAAVCLVFGRSTGQTLTTIYSFSGDDGSSPQAGLIVSGNTIYGTTFQGGLGGGGAVFALSTDGTGFTNLYSFPDLFALPTAGLIFLGDTVDGSTSRGGSGYGTLFSVNTDGSGSRVLHNFTGFPNNPQTNGDGAFPDSGLVLSFQTLYGATEAGGTLGYGTVFAINTNGTGFTNLHNFNGDGDGAFPSAGLVLSGEVLFGTTENGGSWNNGTVFSLKTDGSILTALHVFSQTNIDSSGVYTNSDGASPESELVLSGKTLFGTASIGGTLGYGSVFALNTNGSGFTNLHNFTGTDGAWPSGSLVLRGNTLYGTTQNGGRSNRGTVFAVYTDGTGFTNLFSFAAPTGPGQFPTNSDGANPVGGLTLSGHTLYGTAAYGGSLGNGTVFSISLPVLPPSLTISPSDQNVILTWPASATGFTLQSITNFVAPVWTAIFPAPVVVNGFNMVTNPISGTQQLFRLSQ